MSAQKVISELRRRGGDVRAKEGKTLKIVAPPGKVTPALRKAIDTFREEILELLNPPEEVKQEPQESFAVIEGMTDSERRMFALADQVDGACVMVYGIGGYRFSKGLS